MLEAWLYVSFLALKSEQTCYLPYHFTKEENCYSKAALGMVTGPPSVAAESGQLGYEMGIFQDARARARIYRQNYILGKGEVNFLVLSLLAKIYFDPDLIILLAQPGLAEIVPGLQLPTLLIRI